MQDPVNLIDPSGLCPWCIAAGIGAAISGGIDLGTQLAQNGGNFGAVNWGSVGTSALIGAGLSALGPTGALLGRGGSRAAQFGYNQAPGLLNRGAMRFGWSGPKNGLDVLSFRNGAKHFDLPGLGLKSGANPIRDGFLSGLLGGSTSGGSCGE